MKIAIIGYSGAGKSTLAKKLAQHFSIPVLHLDRVGWANDWRPRDQEEARGILSDFLDAHVDWVIEGNWGQLDNDRRNKEADMIVFLNFPRRICFPRALKRFFHYVGRTRDDIADGCNERFNLIFVWWILYEGRNKERIAEYRRIASEFNEKFYDLKSPRDVEKFTRRTIQVL